MVDSSIKLPYNNIVALNVSEGDYMANYAANHHEWVGGTVVKMSSVSFGHDQLVAYLRRLLDTYFTLNKIGTVVGNPFVMRLTLKDKITRREPDLQIILQDNPNKLYNTYLDGAADICIEVVSPGSIAADYGEKFAEYEEGGVDEYWVIDPARKAAYFHRLDNENLFRPMAVGDDGYYSTPGLPHLKLHVPTLWKAPLPNIIQTVESVQAMLKDVDLDA